MVDDERVLARSTSNGLRWIRWNQWWAYWLSRVGSGLTFRRRVLSQLAAGDIDPGLHYIIAANHQSRVDPFIICGSVPPEAWRRLGTFRYLAHNGLFRNPVLGWLLLGLGCFPTKPLGGRPFGLAAGADFLSQGQSIFIFPEGKRALPGTVRAHHGVEVLGANPLVRVIPVHLRWRRGSFGRRRSYRITVGKPLPASQSAEAVVRAIYELPLP